MKQLVKSSHQEGLPKCVIAIRIRLFLMKKHLIRTPIKTYKMEIEYMSSLNH